MPHQPTKLFRIDDRGQRILQVHSRGDKRFSPFFCSVQAFGVWSSIENHYQRSKLFLADKGENGQPDIELRAKDWQTAKDFANNFPLVGWQFSQYGKPADPRFRFPVKFKNDNPALGLSIDDWGVQFYIALWYKYLAQEKNQYLLEIAAKYEDFEDIFKGKFPFSQAEVFRTVTRSSDGVRGLLSYCQPLLDFFKESSK